MSFAQSAFWRESLCFRFSTLNSPRYFMLSGFVDYKHLAKLVLYAALSKESKRLAERIRRGPT